MCGWGRGEGDVPGWAETSLHMARTPAWRSEAAPPRWAVARAALQIPHLHSCRVPSCLSFGFEDPQVFRCLHSETCFLDQTPVEFKEVPGAAGQAGSWAWTVWLLVDRSDTHMFLHHGVAHRAGDVHRAGDIRSGISLPISASWLPPVQCHHFTSTEVYGWHFQGLCPSKNGE